MKKKDLLELKTKSKEEITSKVRSMEKEKMNVQIELKMGKNKNVHQATQIKKSIAQALTIARLKEIVGRQKINREPENRRENATS